MFNERDRLIDNVTVLEIKHSLSRERVEILKIQLRLVNDMIRTLGTSPPRTEAPASRFLRRIVPDFVRNGSPVLRVLLEVGWPFDLRAVLCKARDTLKLEIACAVVEAKRDAKSLHAAGARLTEFERIHPEQAQH